MDRLILGVILGLLALVAYLLWFSAPPPSEAPSPPEVLININVQDERGMCRLLIGSKALVLNGTVLNALGRRGIGLPEELEAKLMPKQREELAKYLWFKIFKKAGYTVAPDAIEAVHVADIDPSILQQAEMDFQEAIQQFYRAVLQNASKTEPERRVDEQNDALSSDTAEEFLLKRVFCYPSSAPPSKGLIKVGLCRVAVDDKAIVFNIAVLEAMGERGTVAVPEEAEEELTPEQRKAATVYVLMRVFKDGGYSIAPDAKEAVTQAVAGIDASVLQQVEMHFRQGLQQWYQAVLQGAQQTEQPDETQKDALSSNTAEEFFLKRMLCP